MKDKKTKKRIFNCGECGVEVITWDKTRKTCSWECRNKLLSKKYKGKIFTQEHKANIKKNHHNVSKENNPNWKGGKMTWNHNIRTTAEFKEWRTSVYERDGFKCIRCGESKSGSLTADHIKPLVIYPELMFKTANGQTLCRVCHYKKNAEDRRDYFLDGHYVRQEAVIISNGL